jgi:hypothetical protein
MAEDDARAAANRNAGWAEMPGKQVFRVERRDRTDAGQTTPATRRGRAIAGVLNGRE